MPVSRTHVSLALLALAVRAADALDLARYPWTQAVTENPTTYFPVGGPPEAQVNLWPEGKMAGYFQGFGPMQRERFVRTEDAPPANQELRFRCSPRHVGTHGHFAMNVNVPTIAPFLVEGSDTAVVIVPSGGGMHLNWDVESVAPAKMYQQLGISAFVVKFRVPVQSWSPSAYLMDTQRAISMVRTSYGFNRVGIHGACFGGKVAMEMSTRESRAYTNVDEADATNYLPDFTVLLYPQGTTIFAQPKYVPPVFSAVSKNDNCVGVRPALMYDRRATKADSKHEIHIYPNGMHGWGTCEFYPFLQNESECEWPTELERFLNEIGMLH